jgi:hypothetical protein
MPVLQPEPSSWPETERERFIRTLRGKYAHIKTSSEDFAKRKMLEIQREEGWKDESVE